jgi:hypothetical protein
MLLAHTFNEPEVNLALEVFLENVHGVLGDRLVSVLLYGSIVFEDLAPGYGDLDFLAVLDAQLTDDDCARLLDIRGPLRSGNYGVICQMIEGAFLPVKMLGPDCRGNGLWWGTSGEKSWERNELGHFVLHTIREHGLVIWGEDVRPRIPEIQRTDILNELLAGCQTTRNHVTPTSLQCLDFLFTAARELLWLKEGRLSSKSESADWGYRNATGEWRRHLPRAKLLRQNPLVANCRDVQEWIRGLGPSISEAIDELEDALKRTIEEDGPTTASSRRGGPRG